MSRSHFLLAFALGCGAALSGVAAAASHMSPPVYGWPQLLRTPHHASYSADPLINASSAVKLGLSWMSPLRAADLGSPVSAYNATLGKTVAYLGDERGDVSAYDESNGRTLWSTSIGFGDSLRATPLVAPDGSLWVATSYGATLYKLDGATGALDCSVKAPIRFDASPMLVTPPGGVPTVYIATNDAGNVNGVELAIRESDCKQIWSFDKWLTLAGAWATTAFGIDANGQGRVYVGTADPDSTMYALDANTGAMVWHFSIQNPPPGQYEIGAGATVSAPGANGFADGVLYFPSKYGILYALDLTTGAKIWQYNFNKDAHTVEGGRSSAALLGTTLVFGMANGVYALDARTGKKLWHYVDPLQEEVISSPAILGPAGSEVVGFGDVTGAVRFLRLSDGKDLYDYQTGNYITSSPAVINGHFLIDSTDGFLYDFAVGGGNTQPGTTTISTPTRGAHLPNPHGMLTVSGTAADKAGVSTVLVAVQSGGPKGPWYDGATGTWVGGAFNNPVTISPRGKAKAQWKFAFPVPSSGSTYQVFANTVDVAGQVDRAGAQSSFTVMPDRGLPQLVLSAALAPPAGSFTAKATGFSPNEMVHFDLQGDSVGDAAADKNGKVANFKILVPVDETFGPSTLTATGKTSGTSSTAPIDITNTWNEAGNGPARSGFEPHDNVLQNTLQATRHGYVARAWLFSAGAPVDSSPAIVAGSAYIGSDAGQFFAVDTASGAPLWTYATPNGKPIHGSAAVDGPRVFFGSDDGFLYSLASATGKPLGKTQLDGVPTSPAIAGGAIFTATDNGTVYSVNEATGTINWSTPLGAAIHSAPSVDPVAGIVVVGDDGGTVSTLAAASGTIVRQAKTGGAITAAAVISAAKIFVGSSDGSLYAYNETDGTPLFTYKAGSPVHAVAATAGNLYVGDDGGSLALIGQASGSVIYKLSFGSSAIVGVAAAADVPFVETANGTIGAIKNSQARILYSYRTSGNLTTQPAIVDGAVYVGAEDGSLYAFTSYGRAPIDSKERRLLAGVRAKLPPALRWSPAAPAHRALRTTRAFEPAGPRDFSLHVDRPHTASTGIASSGGPVFRQGKDYLIYWTPADSATPVALESARAALQRGAVLSGAAIDSAPYPRYLDDGSVQREIAREVAAERWNLGSGARIFVVTGDAMTASANGYCAYHSALHLGSKLAAPLWYGFVPHPDAASRCPALAPELARIQAAMRNDRNP